MKRKGKNIQNFCVLYNNLMIAYSREIQVHIMLYNISLLVHVL